MKNCEGEKTGLLRQDGGYGMARNRNMRAMAFFGSLK